MLELRIATTWWQRLRGLIGRGTLLAHEGLWIPRCCAIHTVGMRFDLAVHFLDSHDNIIRSHMRVKPMRVLRCPRAASVIEMHAVADAAGLAWQIECLQTTIAGQRYTDMQ